MNEENNVITMDTESVTVLLQNMQKNSKWLSAFWKVTVLRWTGNVTCRQGGGGTAPCEPPYLAGIPE